MSNRFLAVIGHVNRTTAFLVTAALLLAALLVGGWFGGLVLGALAAGMLGLLARIWNALTPGGRVARLALLTILMAVAILQVRA